MNKEEKMDLFIPLFTDITPRDVQDTMAYPFFHTSKRKRVKPIEYDDGRVNIKVEGIQSVGIASIYDKDMLQWGISRVREQLDRGEKTKPEIFFQPYDLLRALNRSTGGKAYTNLEEGLIRLKSTFIRTTIREEHILEKKGFSWIDSYSTKADRKTGEPKGMWSLTLSNWLYQGAVNHKNVLTFSSEYFSLESGIAKTLYLIGRKYAGKAPYGRAISMKKLYQLSASSRQYKYFARDVRDIIKENDGKIADYHLSLFDTEGEEKVMFGSLRHLHSSVINYFSRTK